MDAVSARVATSEQRVTRPWRIGALALLVAIAGTPIGAPATRAATLDLASNCSVSLRLVPSTSGTALTILPTGSVITYADVVPGGAWSATCGSLVSGSTWYAISAVNETPVSALYGASVAYAAAGLFRAVDASTFVEGVDVSKWQGSIDYAAVRNAGKRFVIAKATEGIGFLDPTYQANKFGASSAGLAMTAYHFARPDLNPANPQGEADWFVDNLGLIPGMLVPALDLEVAVTLSAPDLQGWVMGWLERVYARTGVRPMIYASPSYWKKYLADTTIFADQGYAMLWVAHWLAAGPTVPANNWSNRGWTFWQYTNCGYVPGIIGCVDLDRFNGPDLTPVTYGADFAVSASPATLTASIGTATTFTLSFSRTFVTSPIQLTVAGLPAGATATWGASSVTDASTTLTVTSSLNGWVTPSGSYPLTITATTGTLVRTATTALVLVDPAPPVVTAPTYQLSYPAKLGTTIPIRTDWSAADPDGVSSYALQRQVVDGTWQDVALPAATATSLGESVSIGSTFRLAARATDAAGYQSDWAPGSEAAVGLSEQTSKSVVYSGTWATSTTKYASGNTLKYATRSGASATYSFTGSGVAWVAYRGPNRGSAKVYIDGVFKKTISLYAPTYGAKQIAFAFNWPSSGAHKIKIVVVGTRGHPRVDVDAFIRLTLR